MFDSKCLNKYGYTISIILIDDMTQRPMLFCVVYQNIFDFTLSKGKVCSAVLQVKIKWWLKREGLAGVLDA